MRWRNPKEELPGVEDTIWLCLHPHKNRGSLLDSAMSIEIVCGKVDVDSDRVYNMDELGLGDCSWSLESDVLGWLPLEEFILPNFKEKK